ncbi:MAG TPA: CpsB/CapC family capsule biosynthesis tyrosine phosphatase, partial [Phaeodactylibacter sp.]|nr:CpsB/CapC family capsule biosynthesis tyrosine phosphatase [Phaeodactylibacter sp.]
METYFQQLQQKWHTAAGANLQLKNFSPYLTWCPGLCNHLLVDTHAHWLPGVDDGAPDTKAGLSMVRQLTEAGFQKIIATPHIMSGRYNNRPEQLQRVFDDFSQEVEAAKIPVQLELAAEY